MPGCYYCEGKEDRGMGGKGLGSAIKSNLLRPQRLFLPAIRVRTLSTWIEGDVVDRVQGRE